MSEKVLVASTTAGGTSEPFNVAAPTIPPVTFCASGLAGTETVKIQIDVNGVWVQCKVSGDDVELSVNDVTITIYGPGRFRVVQTATASAAQTLIYYNDGL